MARYMPDEWPIPALDKWNRDFFTAGKLVVQQCASCGTLQHPPEEICNKCLGFEFQPHETNGEGTIYCYNIVHYAAAPVLQQRVPYGVVLVSLDQHPEIRILGNVLNRKPEELAIGQKVKVTFEEIVDEEVNETILMPQWEVVE